MEAPEPSRTFQALVTTQSCDFSVSIREGLECGEGEGEGLRLAFKPEKSQVRFLRKGYS